MNAAPHLSQPQISHLSIPLSQQYQSRINHQTSSVPQLAYHSPQVSTQPMNEFPQLDSGFVVPVFTQGDDPIACLNKAMAFLLAVAASSYAGTGYKGEGHMARQCTQPKRPRNAAWFKYKEMLAKAHKSGQILDEEQLAFFADPGIPDDAYDSDCDDVSIAQAIPMANLSNYGLDVISEDFEQTPVVDFRDNKITSDSNIIPYSQYLQETQHAAVYDTNLYAQQDSMILSVIEQIVISNQHAVIPVIDDEETLVLKEVSQSKMLAKQNDPISKDKKINTTLINYVELNRLSEDFDKRFVPQQAFWLQTSHPNTDQSDISPIKIEAPRELPKVSLVNTSLKKLKYRLGKFDTVVKKRITPDAITEGEWRLNILKLFF
ncbi:hypothetical protein Tco_0273714 [Tanacetum coccineum]